MTTSRPPSEAGEPDEGDAAGASRIRRLVDAFRFDGTDRGQTAVIGAVLMLGIAIIALASYQTFLVPIDNEQVEFDSYQDAQQSLAEYRDSVVTSSSKGYSFEQRVTLGTTYPTRVVAINPPPALGRVETVQSGNVTVANATASGDVGDYWDGSSKEFETVHLTYTPNYDRIAVPPVTVTGSLMYQRTDGGYNPQSAQSVINGKRIAVTTLSGDIDQTGRETTLAVEPVSTSTRQVAVTADSDPDGDGNPELFVTVPTELPASAWQELLAEEPNVVSVSDVSEGVRVELDGNVTYDLSVTRVELREATDGSDAPTTAPHYLVRQPAGTAVSPNETTELAVEVRDRYDNPVSDVAVTFSGTNLTATTVTTDDDGLASIEYTPETRGVKTVDAEFGGGDVARERVSFTVRAHTAGFEGGAKGTGFEGQDQFLDMGTTSGVFMDAEINSGDLEITFNNTATENRTIVDVRWIVYLGVEPIVRITFDGTTYDIGEGFEPLDPSSLLEPGESRTFAVTDVYNTAGESTDIANSDMYFLSVRYETPAGEFKISTYAMGA